MVTQNHQVESHNPLTARKFVTTYQELEPSWRDKTTATTETTDTHSHNWNTKTHKQYWESERKLRERMRKSEEERERRENRWLLRKLGMFFMFKIYVNWERDQYHFLILFLLHFCAIFLFWEERDIKFEQKYIFTLDFNRGGLRKTNRTYLR